MKRICKKRKFRLSVAAILLVLALSAALFVGNAEKCARQFASGAGSTFVSLVLQKSLNEKIKSEQREYLSVQKSPDGRVQSIFVDSASVTLLASDLAILVLETVKGFESDRFGIPLGNAFGMALLSGRGPLIPVKPVISGNAAWEVGSELLEAGINQTLYRIKITFDLALLFLSPFETCESSIRFDVIVAETLVIGEIPIVYHS